VVWGKVKEGGQSPLAWLLHGDGSIDTKAIAARYDKLGRAALRAEVERLVARSGGTIALRPLPAPTAARLAGDATAGATLQPRRLEHPMRRGYTIASFTALTAEEADERPDFDQGDAALAEPGETPLDPHGFPRGARAGRCLHGILEAIDFVTPDR